MNNVDKKISGISDGQVLPLNAISPDQYEVAVSLEKIATGFFAGAFLVKCDDCSGSGRFGAEACFQCLGSGILFDHGVSTAFLDVEADMYAIDYNYGKYLTSQIHRIVTESGVIS